MKIHFNEHVCIIRLSQFKYIIYAWGLTTFIQGQFHRNCTRYLCLLWVWKLLMQNYSCISQGQMGQSDSVIIVTTLTMDLFPDSKVRGAKMGPTWVLSAPDGPHVGPHEICYQGCDVLAEVRDISVATLSMIKTIKPPLQTTLVFKSFYE